MPTRSSHRRGTRAVAPLMALLALVAGCAHGRVAVEVDSSTRLTGLAARLADAPDVTGTDVVAVWICHVPTDTTDPTFEPDDPRLDLHPADVVDRTATRLATYFSSISHGTYTVSLRPGGEVSMTRTDDPAACLGHAIDQQVAADAGLPPAQRATVVLGVADAEHTATAEGGWGTAGASASCAPGCTLATSRRAAYLGASDFHPDWGATPPLDLVEHELGHTLGLPHSGVPSGPSGMDPYLSPLDLMSDSAAPRAVDPDRRDGPDILAVDRVALGWLPPSDVTEVQVDADVELAPSTGGSGARLAVVALGDHRMLSIEYLTATGYDDHLPRSGVSVHLVDDTAARDAVGGGTERLQQVLGDAVGEDGLLVAGQTFDVDGWTVTVTSLAATNAQVALRATGE